MKIALTIALIISTSSFVRGAGITCPDEGFFYNGFVDCTNGNFAGSVCVYTCNEEKGFVLEPPEVTTNQCLNDSTWSLPRPCCAATCPPRVNFDVVIVMDSSRSVSHETYELMKEFVKLFVALFDRRPGASRVGVFCYSSKVDTQTQIRLRHYYTGQLDELRGIIDRFPHLAEETHTGRALRHARKDFLDEYLGGRPGVHKIILLLTNCYSQDNVRWISQQLREEGTVVVVIAVCPFGSCYSAREELWEIATRPEGVLFTDVRGSLDVNLFGEVLDQFCVEECLKV